MLLHTGDADLSLEASTQLEPFVLVIGEIGTANATYLLAVESEIILESKTFIDAIFDVIGTYFNFDICYSKQLTSILFFFQSYVFNVDLNTKKIPDPLTSFVSLANSLN